MSDEYKRKLMGEIESFIDDSGLKPDIHGAVRLKMTELMRYSPFVCERLESDFFKVYPSIRNILSSKFDEPNKEGVKTINIISPKEMLPTPIEQLTQGKEGQLLKFQGFILSSSNIITQTTYTYTCSACKRSYHSNRIMKECRYQKCRQHLCDNDYTKVVENYRELVFQEQIDGRQFCETISMKLDIPKHHKSSYITFPNLFGNKLEIMGVMALVESGLGKDKKPIFETMIRIFGIKKMQESNLKPERMLEVKNFIEDNKDDIIKICADHIGCNIYGYEYEKQALLLTVVGLEKDCRALAGRNSQMVTIMFSDAGKGKSNMSKKFLEYLPNSKYITANTSKAGLGGGVEKTASGTYVFTMGELPYSNNSFVILDEIDNLEKEHSDIMLTVISEGIIKVTKIKRFEMPVHINFIVQGNPRNSFFDPHTPFFSQLTLTRPFLDRADFLIILHDPYDETNAEEVNAFAQAVLTDNQCKRKYPDQLIKDTLFFIKNYVPNPLFNSESNKAMTDYWIKLKELRNGVMRDAGEKREDVRPVGARSLVSIAKISLAVARFRMNEYVTKEDVDIGYNIYYQSSIKNLITDYGGLDSYAVQTVDIRGNVTRPTSKSQLRHWIIQKLGRQKEGIMETEELVSFIVDKFDFSRSVVDEIIEGLKKEGELTFPRPHLVQVFGGQTSVEKDEGDDANE